MQCHERSRNPNKFPTLPDAVYSAVRTSGKATTRRGKALTAIVGESSLYKRVLDHLTFLMRDASTPALESIVETTTRGAALPTVAPLRQSVFSIGHREVFDRSVSRVLGINAYGHGVPRLKTAVPDAEAARLPR